MPTQFKEVRSVAMPCSAVLQTADRSEAPRLWQDGEILHIGTLAKGSIVTDGYFWVNSKFPTGATIDIGHGTYAPTGELEDIVVTDTVKADNYDTVRLSLFTALVDSSGADTGETMIRVTDGHLKMVARLHLTGEPNSTGAALFSFEHMSVSISTGEYSV